MVELRLYVYGNINASLVRSVNSQTHARTHANAAVKFLCNTYIQETYSFLFFFLLIVDGTHAPGDLVELFCLPTARI